MIRLRRTLERGRRHPVLGPIVLVLLVLLLAMTWLHTAHDGWDGAVALGVVCVVLATILGGLVLGRVARFVPVLAWHSELDRGPPPSVHAGLVGVPRPVRLELVPPLRR